MTEPHSKFITILRFFVLTQLVEVRKSEGWDKQIRHRVHEIANKISHQSNDMAIGRVAVRFALVQAGLELAHSFDLLPDTVTNNVEYCVPTSIFAKELADGVEKSELVKELQARGWLKPSLEDDRYTVKRTIEGKRIPVFAFREFWHEQDKKQIDLGDNKTNGTRGAYP